MTDIEKRADHVRRNTTMTEADKEQQRRSFAWGNVHIENPRVTRQMVDEAATANKR